MEAILDFIIVVEDAELLRLYLPAAIGSVHVLQENLDGIPVDDGMEEVEVEVL